VNVLSIAVEPVPSTWIDGQQGVEGAARMHFTVDGQSLQDLTVAAGASPHLRPPDVRDESYLDALGNGASGGRWSPADREWLVALLSNGPYLAGEGAYCARIRVRPALVRWEELGSYPPLAPQDLPPDVSARDAEQSPLAFEGDEYHSTLQAARQLFRRVALSDDSIARDPARRQLDKQLRRVHVLEALRRAAESPAVLGELDPLTGPQTRWGPVRHIQRTLEVGLQPAFAVLDSLAQGAPDDPAELLDEQRRLIAEIDASVGEAEATERAHVRITRQ
jgi:hypothetical protein